MSYKSLETEPYVTALALMLDDIDQKVQEKDRKVLQRYVNFVENVTNPITRYICNWLCLGFYTYQAAKRELRKEYSKTY